MGDTPYKDKDSSCPAQWKQSPPNDNFSYFTNGDDITVIMQTQGSFKLDSADKFRSHRLHIYAETIQLAGGNIVQPGKELGLFCNKLELPTGQLAATISVTGNAGDAGAPNVVLSAANNGKPGGSIVVYVEEYTTDLLPTFNDKQQKTGLYLQAYGGAGGRGATNIGDGKDDGGPGGNGGVGGNITVYFGHALLGKVDVLASLINDAKVSWLAKLLRVPKFDFGNELSDGSKKMLLNAVEEALEEAKPLDDTRKLLGILSFEGSPEAKDLEDRKDKLLNLVTKFQQSPTESNITSDTKAAIKRSHDVLDQLRQADTPFKSEQIDEFKTSTDLVLSELGKAVRTFRSTAESKVQLALGVVRKEYAARVNEVSKRMKFSYACGKGHGGQGGTGALLGSSKGKNGVSGTSDGQMTILPVSFSGSAQSLAVADAVVHPDQCQMLLNIADLKYFAASGGEVVQKITSEEMKERERNAEIRGTSESFATSTPPTQSSSSGEPTPQQSRFEDARKLYEKLVKRLHFVPALQQQLQASRGIEFSKLPNEEQAKYGLVKAFAEMTTAKLCLNPITQLLQVYDHAVQRLHWSSIGKDFMGHAGLWVPRLTFKFYEEELRTFMTQAVELATALQAEEGRAQAKEALEKSHKNCQLQLNGAEIRIKLLSGVPNGELKVIGSQIVEFTPILKAKRNMLQAKISEAKIKVKSSWNWDPKIILDALCMIAFAPDGLLNAAAQTANGVYRMATTVQSADGQGVEKSYVVSQFSDAGSSLEDLASAFKARPDGTVAVDDPGASKLMSTKAELGKLIKNFKDTLGDALSTDLKQQLDDYVSVVEKRNRAVLEYNSCLQLLVKAKADRDFYSKRNEELGQLVLSTYDPEAPSLRLWLLKNRQDLRYTILTTLYRAERALQFWGLNDTLPPIPSAQDFSDIALLKSRMTTFHERFIDNLVTRSNNPGTVWPEIESGKSTRVRGKFFHLPAADVERFWKYPSKQRTVDEHSEEYLLYEAYFTISPVRKAASKAFEDLSGHSDVRIDSVRAWLYGAAVGRRDNKAELKVNLVHLGSEGIVSESNVLYDFNHDAIRLQCTYDPTNLKTAQDIPNATVYDTQKLNSFRSLVLAAKAETNELVTASFGPFAQWRLSVSSRENLDLNLTGVTDIAIEFTGESRGFS